MNPDWIIPQWDAPRAVRSLSTTRAGGCSTGPWRGLNLGLNSGDEQANVLQNRKVLRNCVPAEPNWLRQVHGVSVFRHGLLASRKTPHSCVDRLKSSAVEPIADAQISSECGAVCVVLTADCLPVLFCNTRGTKVAAAHAGWRGLAAGVLDQTVLALDEPAANLLAWMGPAIGASAYEVGDDVRDAFLLQDQGTAACFKPQGKKWLCDLYAVARRRLARIGVNEVRGGTECTYSDPERFYSYRRDGMTGRMASLIWLQS